MRTRSLFFVALAAPLVLGGCHHGPGGSGPEAAGKGPAVAPPAHHGGPSSPNTPPGAFDGTWRLDALAWSHTRCVSTAGPLPKFGMAEWNEVKTNPQFHMDFDLEPDSHGRLKIRLKEQGKGAHRVILEYECCGDDVDACKDVPIQRFTWQDGAWTLAQHDPVMPSHGECGTGRFVQQLSLAGGRVRLVKTWLVERWKAPGPTIFSCATSDPPPKGVYHCGHQLVFDAVRL